HQLARERALLRLDGHYGTGAVLADLAGCSLVRGGPDDAVLDHPLVQARLPLPKDSVPGSDSKASWCAASPTALRCLWDLGAGLAAWGWQPDRAGNKKSRGGVTRWGVVYELFFPTVPRASVHRLRGRRVGSASRRL